MCQDLIASDTHEIHNDTHIPTYTLCGHIVGMLDRDQRTAKITRCGQSLYKMLCHKNLKVYSVSANENISQANPRTFSRLTNRKNNYIWKSLQKLKQFFIVGAYLFSIINIPESISAPIDHPTSNQVPEFWVNPCQYETENFAKNPTKIMSSDVARILSQVKISHNKACEFKDEYLQQSPLDPGTVKKHQYGWFPNETELNTAASTSAESYITSVYRSLQKFAAVIELIINDQQAQHGKFIDEFNSTKNYLKSILCEMQEFLTDDVDIKREDISEELIATNVTEQTIRDWLTLRDYIFTLEHIIQTLEKFKERTAE